MWTERPTEQLQKAAQKIEQDLVSEQDPLSVAQYVRVLGAITAHLSSLSPEQGTDVVDGIEIVEPEVSTIADATGAIEVFGEKESVSGATVDSQADPTYEWGMSTTFGPESLPIGPIVPETYTEEADSSSIEDPQALRKVSSIVESGTTGLWADTRKVPKQKVSSEHEISVLRTPNKKARDTTGLEPYLIRFDPDLGVYTENGRMIADPTESKLIQANIEVIIETAHYLAYLSNENPVITQDYVAPVDRILSDLGFAELPPFAKNSLIRELGRLLTPTQALSIYKNRRQTYIVTIRHPFTFVVTDLEPRKSRAPVHEPVDAEQHYAICEWDREGSVRDMLLQKRVPRPTTHPQAIELLEAVMWNDELTDSLLKTNTSATIQRVFDLAHTLSQEALGWSGYMHARRARTMRGGQRGYSNTIRQITGTQRSERFQRNIDMVPRPKQN